MTVLAPIYPETHRNKVWKHATNYEFAGAIAVIPLMGTEISKVLPSMPIGFIKQGTDFQLVAIASLRSGTNLYVAPDGRWLGNYIPATLRAYPFRLLELENSEESILCINEASGLVFENTEEGNAFFDDKDHPTKMTNDILKFLVEVAVDLANTGKILKALDDIGLIIPWELSHEQDEKVVLLKGLFRIDEEAMNKMDDEAFLTLRKSGGLAIPYGQLMSVNQLSTLEQLEQRRREGPQHANSKADSLDDFSLAEDGGSLVFD